MADFRSVLNARLRTSTTAAIRLTAPLDLAARSTIVGSRPGGRLSTTNQPRSSSDLAAVDRPAPDRPVMMTMSAMSSAVLMTFPPKGGRGGLGGAGARGGAGGRRGGGRGSRGEGAAHGANTVEMVAANRAPMPGTA